MTYGFGYMGSKSKIAEWIVDTLPKAEHFYDLFAGGCAITHCAMLRHKANFYHINDLDKQPIELFTNAIKGKYENENRWISRADFHKLKAKDPYVAYCWSFGNAGCNYLYRPDLEPLKKALHYASFFADVSLYKDFGFEVPKPTKATKTERKLEVGRFLKAHRKEFLNCYCEWIKKQNIELESLESLERLERLESLESLESLERLEATNKDYREIKIKENSVIYCDIPYTNTETYKVGKFDINAFYKWSEKQKEPLYISSYYLPDDRFICVGEFKHISCLNDKKSFFVIEKLYMPKHQENLKPKMSLFDC